MDKQTTILENTWNFKRYSKHGEQRRNLYTKRENIIYAKTPITNIDNKIKTRTTTPHEYLDQIITPSHGNNARKHIMSFDKYKINLQYNNIRRIYKQYAQ